MKLSEPMKAVIRNLYRGKPANYGLHGMSAHGGLCATESALHRRGLLAPDGTLSERGKEIAKEICK